MRATYESSTASAIAASTADAAFVTDSRGTIVAWNEAARRLLGYERAEACGEECFTLLAGHDIFGNRYCSPHCPLLDMANRNEAVGQFEIAFRDSSGEMSRARVSVVTVPNSGATGRGMVHILHPIPNPVMNEGSGRPSIYPGRFENQTPREAEVLQLMADGKSTQEIADALFISVATVRHHVQSILRKLDVHSRLEAVAALHHLRSV